MEVEYDLKEALLVLIRADLRYRSLYFLFSNKHRIDISFDNTLMKEILRWFDFPHGEAYQTMEELYLDYVHERLEALSFEDFRIILDNTANELYMLLITFKRLIDLEVLQS